MKKFVAFGLSLSLALGLTACGSASGNSSAGGNNGAATTSEQKTEIV